jgi:beta-phosphoglucomutase
MKIKAVVFDMDGVLIDAKDWHYEALNQALGLFGYEISRHEHLTTYDGLPTRTKLEMLTTEYLLPSGLHEFINEMKQIYTLQLAVARCAPIFIHEYALSRLKSEGYLLGVASNSVRASVKLMMDKAHLTGWLDVMLSAQDVDKPKPAPDLYLSSAEKLGVRPDECLVVEDNQHGIAAAQAAGTNALAVRGVTDVTYQNITKRIREVEAQL